MASAREYISQVRSFSKLISSDQSINDRSILSALVKNRNMLVNQRLNDRKLWMTDSLFTNLCIEMKQVPLAECCSYISEINISRSKLPIPKINEGIYNYAIKGVYNVESTKKFTEVTPDIFIQLLQLEKRRKETYFWIMNNYIYTTNPNLQTVKLSAFFEDHDLPKNILFPSCECNLVKYDNSDLCQNPLDREFKFAGYLSSNLIDMTTKYLLGTYFQLKEDVTSNNLDESSK